MNLFNHLKWVSRKRIMCFFFRHMIMLSSISALNAYRQTKNEPKLDFTEEKIIIPSYASLWSVLFNQNNLGFNRDRNGANF